MSVVVTVYSKPYCPFCTHAKNFLENKQIPYEVIELDPLSDEYDKKVDQLITDTKHRTFPFIFAGTKFIGGFTDMVAAYNDLSFQRILEEQGLKIEVDF